MVTFPLRVGLWMAYKCSVIRLSDHHWTVLPGRIHQGGDEIRCNHWESQDFLRNRFRPLAFEGGELRTVSSRVWKIPMFLPKKVAWFFRVVSPNFLGFGWFLANGRGGNDLTTKLWQKLGEKMDGDPLKVGHNNWRFFGQLQSRISDFHTLVNTEKNLRKKLLLYKWSYLCTLNKWPKINECTGFFPLL